MADKPIPPGFQGFLYEPSNEQETIGLFLILQSLIRPTWCTKRLQGDFPDGMFYDSARNAEVRVEFEYLASHFFDHQHDPTGCELIICWENDLPRTATEPLGLQVLALKEELSHLPNKTQFCLGWKRDGSLDKVLQAEVAQDNRCAQAVQRLVDVELPRLSEQYLGLRVERNLSAHYMVRWYGRSLFGVYPNGKLVVLSVGELAKACDGHLNGAAERFHATLRTQVRGLNVSPKAPDAELEARLQMLIGAIDALCSELNRAVSV